MVLATFCELSTAQLSWSNRIGGKNSPGLCRMVIHVSSQLRPELSKHDSVCWLLLPPLFGIWRWPDFSPAETPLSLCDLLKPHQKINPKNLCSVPAVGGQCQDSAASWIPQEQLYLCLWKMCFLIGGTLMPEESQPKRHLEATKIKIPKISLPSSESSL